MVFSFAFANQNSGPSSPFGFVGEVPTRSESTSSAPADPRPACLPRLGRGPELLGELVGALDRSFLEMTLNLQSEVRRLSRPEIPTGSLSPLPLLPISVPSVVKTPRHFVLP